MTRRSAIIVVALVVAALVGVGLMVVPASPLHQKPTLGLDLQGGLEITKQAVPPKGRKLTKEDLDRSVSIMRDRVDRLGVSEPEIRTQGNDQITIQLPGVKDPETAAKIIGKTAQLELYDLEANLVPPSIDASAHPVAKELRLRPARRPAGARRQGNARAVLALQQAEEARRRARLDEDGGAREVQRQAAGRLQALRGAARNRRHLVRRRRGRLPRRPAVEPDVELVLPVQVLAARRPGDDRLRPEALRARGRTSTRRRRRRS